MVFGVDNSKSISHPAASQHFVSDYIPSAIAVFFIPYWAHYNVFLLSFDLSTPPIYRSSCLSNKTEIACLNLLLFSSAVMAFIVVLSFLFIIRPNFMPEGKALKEDLMVRSCVGHCWISKTELDAINSEDFRAVITFLSSPSQRKRRCRKNRSS